MDSAVAAVVLVSAVLHPLWYAFVKTSRDADASYLAVIAGLTAAGIGHGLIAGADFAAVLLAWPALLTSIAGQVVYGLCIVAVLKRGDLSAYYPIIRSAPIAIVLIGWAAFGERYGLPLLGGILLAVAGAFALQRKAGVRLLADPASFALSVAAMTAAAVYSLADASLARIAHPAVVLATIQGPTVPLFAWLYGRNRPDWRLCLPLNFWRATPWRHLLMGPIAYTSYYLILIAYGLGGNVAAVNAVRQVAIPVSVLIGALWLGEGGTRREMWRRLGAASVLATGVVVIILSR